MRHLPRCHASLQLLELCGVQACSSSLLCAAAASSGYPGTPPGAAPDVSGLLGQGMTAAGLHTILQQQSHRMPPDVVRICCPGLRVPLRRLTIKSGGNSSADLHIGAR